MESVKFSIVLKTFSTLFSKFENSTRDYKYYRIMIIIIVLTTCAWFHQLKSVYILQCVSCTGILNMIFYDLFLIFPERMELPNLYSIHIIWIQTSLFKVGCHDQSNCCSDYLSLTIIGFKVGDSVYLYSISEMKMTSSWLLKPHVNQWH